VKETVWHRALLFGDEARKKVETLTKGSFVSLSGELTYRPRRRSEDGAVAEILVKQLTQPGITATQKGRAGAHSTGFDPPAAQSALLTASNAPLTYAPGEHF
jgi:single-stranded DNA-binding protein